MTMRPCSNASLSMNGEYKQRHGPGRQWPNPRTCIEPSIASSKRGARRDKVEEGALPPRELEREFTRVRLPIRPPYAPMEAKLVDEIPRGRNWQYEPEWDGFRCMAFRQAGTVNFAVEGGSAAGAMLS